MTTGTEWRIERREYFDEFGKVTSTDFAIYTNKRWLGLFYYKSYVKHTECGWGDCSKTKTCFKEIDEAREFISTKLCPGGPIDKNIYTDVETIKCN